MGTTPSTMGTTPVPCGPTPTIPAQPLPTADSGLEVGGGGRPAGQGAGLRSLPRGGERTIDEHPTLPISPCAAHTLPDHLPSAMGCMVCKLVLADFGGIGLPLSPEIVRVHEHGWAPTVPSFKIVPLCVSTSSEHLLQEFG